MSQSGPAKSSAALRWWVRFSLLLAGVVVVLGAFTRLVDAGLGCPDWPGCYGHLLWPNDAQEIAAAEARFPDAPVDLSKTWPEMVHRYFASALGLVILIFTVLAWKGRALAQSDGLRLPVGLTTGLLLMVLLQGAFGAWTVTLKLWPQVVTAHLLGGFTTLSAFMVAGATHWSPGPLRALWAARAVAAPRLAGVAGRGAADCLGGLGIFQLCGARLPGLSRLSWRAVAWRHGLGRRLQHCPVRGSQLFRRLARK